METLCFDCSAEAQLINNIIIVL